MRTLTFIDRSTGRPTVVGWAGLGVCAVVLAAVSIPINSVAYGIPLGVAFVLGLLQGGVVPLAAARPQLALGLSLVPLVLFAVLSLDSEGAPWPVSVTTLIVQAAMVVVIAFVATWRLAIRAWFLSALAVAAVIGASPARYDSLDSSLASAIPFTAITGGLLVIALLLAQRGSIRAQLERERRFAAVEQGRREVVEERNRIARELHDVVAHGMSVIQVQASSAKYRLPELGEAAAAEFDDIGATARNALAEMRQLLGVLRREDSAAELGPQPGLFEIPALVDSARRTGAPVSLEWSVNGQHPVSPAVALAAYRIVQESLSNAVRHAPGAITTVVVTRTATAIDIRVENGAAPEPLDPSSAASGSGGHGLIGMRERVLLVGGTLEHRPTDSGGFLVSAHLPVPASDLETR